MLILEDHSELYYSKEKIQRIYSFSVDFILVHYRYRFREQQAEKSENRNTV
jgi:hypothetical protein